MSMARTRQRIIDEAERLFRAQGYASTSLEEIAEAASVTKGAIYGHFSSKEDLLLSAVEASPTPDYGAVLNDRGRPLVERLAEFGRTMAVDEATTDRPRLALSLEFVAALLRSPTALERYSTDLEGRLEALAAADDEQPESDTTTAEAWAIGFALFLGLQIYQCLTPGIVTPAVFERAYVLLAGLYPET
jgi:AcrR family transcriptional regulator